MTSSHANLPTSPFRHARHRLVSPVLSAPPDRGTFVHIPALKFILPFFLWFYKFSISVIFSPFPVSAWVQTVLHDIPYNRHVRGTVAARTRPSTALFVLRNFSARKGLGRALGSTQPSRQWAPRRFLWVKTAELDAHHSQPLALTLWMIRATIPVLFYTFMASTGMILHLSPWNSINKAGKVRIT